MQYSSFFESHGGTVLVFFRPYFAHSVCEFRSSKHNYIIERPKQTLARSAVEQLLHRCTDWGVIQTSTLQRQLSLRRYRRMSLKSVIFRSLGEMIFISGIWWTVKLDHSYTMVCNCQRQASSFAKNSSNDPKTC